MTRVIGAPTAHVDSIAKTTGTARYTGDLSFEGLLHGAVLRSTVPFADIVSVDTSAARTRPGVRAVVTGADFPGQTYAGLGGDLSDRRPISTDRVRYYGEEVAVVVADTLAQARAALPFIRVRYRRRRPLLTIARSRRTGAQAIHDSHVGNVATARHYGYGDLDAARAGVATTLTRSYFSGRHTHVCMEPHTVVAQWRAADQTLHVTAPSQATRNIQKELAHVLELELEQVRLHEVFTGGDFGSRVKISDLEALAAMGSIRTGAPVRISLSREDEFRYSKSRYPVTTTLTLGADDDGRMRYYEGRLQIDVGAYVHGGAGDFGFVGPVATSLYDVDAAVADTEAVYTTKRHSGSFRGAGLPQATFARESAVDELADQLGRDPLDLRLANLTRPPETAGPWHLDNARLRACLVEAADRLGWRELRNRPADDGPVARGVGIAVAVGVTGVGKMTASAILEIHTDGSIVLRSGLSDPGTGQKTIAAQIAAEALGVQPSDVTVLTGDTALTPYDGGAGASKGTYITGNAVRLAAEATAAELSALAAAKFGVDADQVSLAGGDAESGEQSVPIADLVDQSALARDGVLAMRGDFHGGRDGADLDLSDAYAYCAQAIEVSVDRDLGRVRLERVVCVVDGGTIVNPTTARGQVEGGIVMALGACLGEELLFTSGRVANASYIDYAMPRSAEIPEIELAFIGSPRATPMGVAGIAEVVLGPTSAAVANAIAHATGIRVRELPITPPTIATQLASNLATPRRPRRRPSLLARLHPVRLWIDLLRAAYPRGLHAFLDRYGTRFARPTPTPPIESLARPSTVSEAADALAAPNARPAGGATDLLVARSAGVGRPVAVVVDLSGAGMGAIAETEDGGLRIGAAVTLAQLEAAPDLARTGLGRAAAAVASAQLREVATVGGNLCQANRCWYFRHGYDCYRRSGVTCPCYAITGDHRYYHAVVDGHRCQAVGPSDLATVLVALDACAEIRSRTGSRTVAMAEFYRGPGEPDLADGEFLTAVVIPVQARARRTVFVKQALWTGGFSVVAAAASVARDETAIRDVRTVLGGVAYRPLRVPEVEERLRGCAVSGLDLGAAAACWESDAHPLANNGWKIEAASTVLERALTTAIEADHGE